jgi:Asp-tRNA(Asn)/Glu-tRNA(Gln) amidotransferase A subunit family amidase
MFGEIADVLIEGSSLTGHTGVNVPVGTIAGLPVGMQLVANHFQEQTILNIAYAYEQAVNWKDNQL